LRDVLSRRRRSTPEKRQKVAEGLFAGEEDWPATSEPARVTPREAVVGAAIALFRSGTIEDRRGSRH
jgi:hypothetical protein